VESARLLLNQGERGRLQVLIRVHRGYDEGRVRTIVDTLKDGVLANGLSRCLGLWVQDRI